MAPLTLRIAAAAAFAAAAAALAGCGAKDAGDYAKMRDDALCAAYGGDDNQRAVVRAEIDKRNLIPSYEWSRVSHGDVSYGMHRCSVLAAWHSPDTMVGSGTSIEIWTYKDDRVVRFQNGMVSSTTDFH